MEANLLNEYRLSLITIRPSDADRDPPDRMIVESP